jgi:hypothetical protein
MSTSTSIEQIRKYLPEINLVCFTLSVVFCLIPWNGNTIADLHSKYSTDLTPAAFTFAIWGIIFGLLYAVGYFSLIPSCRQKAIDAFGFKFVGTSIFQVSSSVN